MCEEEGKNEGVGVSVRECVRVRRRVLSVMVAACGVVWSMMES